MIYLYALLFFMFMNIPRHSSAAGTPESTPTYTAMINTNYIIMGNGENKDVCCFLQRMIKIKYVTIYICRALEVRTQQKKAYPFQAIKIGTFDSNLESCLILGKIGRFCPAHEIHSLHSQPECAAIHFAHCNQLTLLP